VIFLVQFIKEGDWIALMDLRVEHRSRCGRSFCCVRSVLKLNRPSLSAEFTHFLSYHFCFEIHDSSVTPGEVSSASMTSDLIGLASDIIEGSMSVQSRI
jgi:hypothetical protein